MLTYGATLQALYFEGKDLVLGYDTLADYENQNGSYQGATIGRYANRIADGKFTLNGKEYVLCCNETGRGHLHGGAVGFDKKVWKAEVLSAELAPAVRFYLVSPDGDEGYPGRLEVALTVTVGDENVLHFEYMARSDADTVVNLTNHSYFNLNGADGSDVLDTLLHLNADYITPVDQQLIPDGSMLAVEGTPFDFRTPKAIGQDIAASHPQLALGGGYDHNYMLSRRRTANFCDMPRRRSPRVQESGCIAIQISRPYSFIPQTASMKLPESMQSRFTSIRAFVWKPSMCPTAQISRNSPPRF